MKIQELRLGPMENNCYLLTNCQTNQTLIVDPGFDMDRLLTAMKGKNPYAILLTHGHFDHMGLVDELRDLWDIPMMIHERDAEALGDPAKNGHRFFFGEEKVYRPAQKTFTDGAVLTVGDESLTVLHTPGHTPGSCCFLTNDAIFTGDTILCHTCGRTDLLGGDPEQMRMSLHKLSLLADQHKSWVLYPGHGAHSTFAMEKIQNPFLK